MPGRAPVPLLIALLLIAARPASADLKTPGVVDEIQAQAAAWNRGDLATFMKGYLRSEELTYTAAGNVVRGYDALAQRYQKRYGSTPETMGKLRFDDISITPLGADHALAVGRWYLHRDSQPDIDGVFSLVWRHTAEGWRILHDHSSLRSKP